MPIKMGVDCEFVLGNPVGAIMRDAHDILNMSGNLGTDGAGRPAEIRADPSEDVDHVVNSMQESMCISTMVAPELMKYPWSNTNLREPCGFHVHFDRDLMAQGTDLSIQLLDLLVALPLALRTGERQLKARLERGYGGLSDARQEHPTSDGTGHRVEYRTLGGVWGTKEDTRNILRWMQLIAPWWHENNQAYETLHAQLVDKLKSVFGADYSTVKSAYATFNGGALEKWLKELRVIVVAMPGLKEVAEPFFDTCAKPDPFSDLKDLWGVKPLPTRDRKIMVVNVKEFQKRRRSGQLKPMEFRTVRKSVRSFMKVSPKEEFRNLDISVIPANSVDDEEDE